MNTNEASKDSAALGGAANKHCVGFAIEHPDFDFAIAISSTSHRDSHGEIVSPQAIKGIVSQINKSCLPFLINHNQSRDTPGALVAAKSFIMPDGETALGVLIIFYTSFASRISFQVGNKNHNWSDYVHLIDPDALLKAHDKKLETHKDVVLPVPLRLQAYLSSHTLNQDGIIRTTKHLIGETHDLKIVVRSRDHLPAHFHVLSKQRGINARFSVDSLEYLDTKNGTISSSDKKLVKNFFKTNPDALEQLKERSKKSLEAS